MYVVAELGRKLDVELQEPADVVTYPCQGITGTLATNELEIPSPLPAITNPKWGQPIVVKGGPTLRLSSATITGPAGNVPIQALYGDGRTPDANAYCKDGWACVVPAELTPNTTYTVNLAWTNAGVPGGRTFTFSTRP